MSSQPSSEMKKERVSRFFGQFIHFEIWLRWKPTKGLSYNSIRKPRIEVGSSPRECIFSKGCVFCAINQDWQNPVSFDFTLVLSINCIPIRYCKNRCIDCNLWKSIDSIARTRFLDSRKSHLHYNVHSVLFFLQISYFQLVVFLLLRMSQFWQCIHWVESKCDTLHFTAENQMLGSNWFPSALKLHPFCKCNNPQGLCILTQFILIFHLYALELFHMAMISNSI